MQPETRYAMSGEVAIAYQVLGDGPFDLVVTPGGVSHLEYLLESPAYAHYVQRLASFSRVITFDKRGTGLSDRVPVATLEERMGDVRAVMDAAGSGRAALFGVSEGGPMSLLFAATYPERVAALVVYGARPSNLWRPDFPWGRTEEQVSTSRDLAQQTWGRTAAPMLSVMAPSIPRDEEAVRWWTAFERTAASPGAVTALSRMNEQIDVRHVLPAIRVPTLVLHRTGERAVPVESGRYLAEHIPYAKLVELPGIDHIPWIGDVDALVDEVEEFLTGTRHGPEPDRVLATVLFTDIVGSTERAVALGDRRWRDLKESHHTLIRHELARYRGREVDTAGDGFLATFDGPGRAIRCACAIRDGVRRLGIEIRAGLHTGECELHGNGVTGIAVHIGARVASTAGPSEVLVSSTVKDLVAGSGIRFAERGTRAEGRARRVEPVRG